MPLTKEDNERITKEVICETRKQFEKAGFKVPAIAKELALIAFSDAADFVTVDKYGNVKAKSLKKIKDKSRIIKKIKYKKELVGGTLEIEWYDKLEALGMGIEIIGIKKPKEIKLNGSLTIDTAGAKQKLIDRVAIIIKRRGKGSGAK